MNCFITVDCSKYYCMKYCCNTVCVAPGCISIINFFLAQSQECEPTSGVVYAELDFAAGRDLPSKPPPAFERVKYADVPVH